MERVELRVIYGDTDQMGVVYYANYLRYFEAARNEFCRAKGVRYRDLEAEHGLILPVTEASVRYALPARYDDLLTVEIALAKAGRASVRFEYRILRAGEVLATGETVHACVGGDGGVRRLPREVIGRLTRGEPAGEAPSGERASPAGARARRDHRGGCAAGRSDPPLPAHPNYAW